MATDVPHERHPGHHPDEVSADLGAHLVASSARDLAWLLHRTATDTRTAA